MIRSVGTLMGRDDVICCACGFCLTVSPAERRAGLVGSTWMCPPCRLTGRAYEYWQDVGEYPERTDDTNREAMRLGTALAMVARLAATKRKGAG